MLRALATSARRGVVSLAPNARMRSQRRLYRVKLTSVGFCDNHGAAVRISNLRIRAPRADDRSAVWFNTAFRKVLEDFYANPDHFAPMSSVVPVSACCLNAAAPSRPPMPIDSTAELGTSINAPFSFKPSYSMFIARR